MLTPYMAAALAAACAASPDLSAHFAGRRTFSLHEVAVNVATRGPWHGATEVQRAYLKYGLAVPESVSESVSRAAARLQLQRLPQQRPGLSGGNGKTSVPVRPAPNDVEFLVPVKVGNHELQLDLDTGSSDLYVCSASSPLPLSTFISPPGH
jgi:aspergillopepsin I